MGLGTTLNTRMPPGLLNNWRKCAKKNNISLATYVINAVESGADDPVSYIPEYAPLERSSTNMNIRIPAPVKERWIVRAKKHGCTLKDYIIAKVRNYQES